jgi:acetate kinase
MSEQLCDRKGLILAVNAGSSSLKISLYRNTSDVSSTEISSDPVELVLVSNITDISAPPALFSLSTRNHDVGSEIKKEPIDSIHDHTSAFVYFLDTLQEKAGIDRSQIVHVCHRVVHGGDFYEPVVITNESYHHIERLSDLAPLYVTSGAIFLRRLTYISRRHNGAALSVIQACIDALSNANSIAYFDTSFHRAIPAHIASYAIDQTIAKQRGLKKYGFHGLSCEWLVIVNPRNIINGLKSILPSSDAYILRTVSAYMKKVSIIHIHCIRTC